MVPWPLVPDSAAKDAASSAFDLPAIVGIEISGASNGISSCPLPLPFAAATVATDISDAAIVGGTSSPVLPSRAAFRFSLRNFAAFTASAFRDLRFSCHSLNLIFRFSHATSKWEAKLRNVKFVSSSTAAISRVDSRMPEPTRPKNEADNL